MIEAKAIGDQTRRNLERSERYGAEVEQQRTKGQLELDEKRSRTWRAEARIGSEPRGAGTWLPGYLMETLKGLPGAHAARLGRVPLPSDPVFRSPKEAALTPGNSANILKLFGRIVKRAKLPSPDERGRTLDLHALRATAATRLLRHGVELALVADALPRPGCGQGWLRRVRVDFHLHKCRISRTIHGPRDSNLRRRL